jgi:EAL domain-containing protein (putative c-di-GMP-specific phosphodiesterase class I)/GGDEF domain-containing protein
MALAVLQLLQSEGGRPAPERLDPITRLPNRQQFHADTVNWGGAKATLVLVTLAEPRAFNAILRALGHARSEAFVRAGAARLIEILGPGTSIYHVGNLSFAFRLPGHPEPDKPAAVDRILKGFRRPITCEDVPIDTNVAVGLKAFGGRGFSPGEDLRAALSAAQDGRGRLEGWAWFDRKSDEAHRRAFRLLSDLNAALVAENQLELHFQPKVFLATGRCAGAEALLRWRHPELGHVSPGEFVALAENTALVTPLTRWVIDAATRQLALWSQADIDLPLAINVSPKNLEEPDFVEYLMFCCAARGIDRGRVELEITEGVSATRGGLLLDRLAALRQLGFAIAIDDFGSGYSNMSYLTRLSAQTLKIDQSLVRGVDPDGLSGRLVAGIVQMGRDLGYKMVAEGIETAAECDTLAGWGCDIGQGWFFGKPMPADAFASWLAGTRARRASSA